MNKFFLILLLYLLNFQLSADVVTGFRLQQTGNDVNIEFTITGGNTCNGIDIFRSTDSISFDVVGSISGICGSTSDDVSYSFTDESPQVNSDNYYKLDLKQLGYSVALKIHVFDQESELLVFPNPVQSEVKIFYPYTYGRRAQLSIYDLHGKLILQTDVSENPFVINTSAFTNGIYFFHLLAGDSGLTEKVIVVN